MTDNGAGGYEEKDENEGSLPRGSGSVYIDEESLEDIEPLKILQEGGLSDNSVLQYFKNISSYKHFSLEEEQELGKRIKNGDTEALKKLVLGNLKFVVSIANKYRNTGMPLADLINQGNIGLLEAAKRYDPDKGVKFITYAVWWIRQAIIQGLTDHTGSVRLPVKQASSLYKINSAKERLTKELKRSPTLSEISAASGVGEENIKDIRRASGNHLSLDAPITAGYDKTFIDSLEDEDSDVEKAVILKTLKASVDEIVKDLEEREALIIMKRFGLDDGNGKTLEEIGEEMKLSRERVRQIEARAMKKLRKKALRKKLNDFLN